MSQQILVGIILVGRLGVCNRSRVGSRGFPPPRGLRAQVDGRVLLHEQERLLLHNDNNNNNNSNNNYNVIMTHVMIVIIQHITIIYSISTGLS